MAYGKIFESLFTGSMVGSGPMVFAVWSYCIANAKPPGFIEINPIILAAIIGCSPEDVQAALDVLSNPDPKSRTKDYDGRRLIPQGQFLYHLPTWEKYNAIRNDIERREQNRAAQERFRSRKQSKPDVSSGKQPSAESAHADADADAEKEGRKEGTLAPLTDQQKAINLLLIDLGIYDIAHQKRLAIVHKLDAQGITAETVAEMWKGLCDRYPKRQDRAAGMLVRMLEGDGVMGNWATLKLNKRKNRKDTA